MELKRYIVIEDCTSMGSSTIAEEDPDGPWVKWEDVEKLLKNTALIADKNKVFSGNLDSQNFLSK